MHRITNDVAEIKECIFHHVNGNKTAKCFDKSAWQFNDNIPVQSIDRSLDNREHLSSDLFEDARRVNSLDLFSLRVTTSAAFNTNIWYFYHPEKEMVVKPRGKNSIFDNSRSNQMKLNVIVTHDKFNGLSYTYHQSDDAFANRFTDKASVLSLDYSQAPFTSVLISHFINNKLYVIRRVLRLWNMVYFKMISWAEKLMGGNVDQVFKFMNGLYKTMSSILASIPENARLFDPYLRYINRRRSIVFNEMLSHHESVRVSYDKFGTMRGCKVYVDPVWFRVNSVSLSKAIPADYLVPMDIYFYPMHETSSGNNANYQKIAGVLNVFRDTCKDLELSYTSKLALKELYDYSIETFYEDHMGDDNIFNRSQIFLPVCMALVCSARNMLSSLSDSFDKNTNGADFKGMPHMMHELDILSIADFTFNKKDTDALLDAYHMLNNLNIRNL